MDKESVERLMAAKTMEEREKILKEYLKKKYPNGHKCLKWFEKNITKIVAFFLRTWKHGEKIKVMIYRFLRVLRPGIKTYKEFRSKELENHNIYNKYVGFNVKYELINYCEVFEYGLRYIWQSENSILYKKDWECADIISQRVEGRGKINAFKFPESEGLINFRGIQGLRIPFAQGIKAVYGLPDENAPKIEHKDYYLDQAPIIACCIPIDDEGQIALSIETIKQNLIKHMNAMPYELILKRLEGKERLCAEPF